MARFAAVLLLGPTGSGKTPLGDCLEAHGLWGRRCAHFDFGANLRAVAAGGERPAGLTARDVSVIADALKTGALLEDAEFPIARKILESFVRRKGLAADSLVVLNGMPRHVGQARAADVFVDVRAVVNLECEPEVVFERIRLNTGGDRAGRVDDDAAAVECKLRLFCERTAPLIEHYRRAGADVFSLDVQVKTTPEELWRRLQACKI